MSKTYRPYNPNQQFLMPPSMRDWLPEDHLSYFVSDVVDEMDLSAIEELVRPGCLRAFLKRRRS